MNFPVEVTPDIPQALQMQFARAVDLYMQDMATEGRCNSEHTDRIYRGVLSVHGEDVRGRDPRLTGREDVKRTLARWPNPNTQRTRRAVLISFYDWMVEEGLRSSSPARQTRRPKARPTSVYRLTRSEAVALLAACEGRQEVRAIHLGLCAGLRSAELRGLQGRHFQREGFIWVSDDIGKGKKERWVPVLEELVPVVEEIRSTVGVDHYVLTGACWADPPFNTQTRPLPERPMAAKVLWGVVRRVGARAGISASLYPHLLRHAFGDHIARHGGLRVAQAMMGHSSSRTTEGYTGTADLDELVIATTGLRYHGAIPSEVTASA